MQSKRDEQGATEKVRISVQVSSGAARFRVAVQAESIERALEIVQGWHSGRECKVMFPIDAEAFFVKKASVAKVEPPGMAA